MLVQIAHLYALGCLAIAFFQVALIAGAPLGPWTQGGQHAGALPVAGRAIAALSIGIVLCQGLAILSAAGFPGLDLPRWTGWAALGVSIVSAILNVITPSARERAVWAPAQVVMSALAAYVMIVTQGGVMTETLPALVYSGLAVLTALFQTALAAGAPYGQWTLGGMYPDRLPAPQRVGAAVQSTLFLAMAMVMAGHAGLVDWDPAIWAVWAAFAITFVAAVGAVMTPSRPERRLWAPVMVAMVLAGGAVALS